MSIETDMLEGRIKVLEEKLQLMDEFLEMMVNTIVTHLKKHAHAAELMDQFNKLRKES